MTIANTILIEKSFSIFFKTYSIHKCIYRYHLLPELGLTICCGMTPRLDNNGSKMRWASNNLKESYLGNILNLNESNSAKSADD